MARKSDRPVIRPDTCSKCRHGTPVPVMKGNSKVVYCNFFNKHFVADSKRNCDYAI